MRETIRCCISCIFPCGALDVIRIVHVNGRVEEISHAVRAGEVMQAYPKHVLRKPPSSSSFCSSEDGSGAPRGPVILPPSAQLQKGKIYFLLPVSSPPEKARSTAPHAAPARKKKKKREQQAAVQSHGGANDTARLLVSDQYLSEILSEKVSTHRDRRRGRVGVWRPHLESISEVANDF